MADQTTTTMADQTKNRTHPKTEKVERVKRIVELMGTGAWEPGITAPALAEEWGLELVSVEQLAVEAKRTVGVVGDVLAAVEADTGERDADLVATLGELQSTVVSIGEAVVSLGRRIEELEAKRGNRPGALEMALRKMARPDPRPAVPEMIDEPEPEQPIHEAS